METNDEFEFFVTTMPQSRPADYHLGCLEGSVFIDFDNHDNDRVRLKRISFDGHGCYDLGNQAWPMEGADSQVLKEFVFSRSSDQLGLTLIIKKTLRRNRKLISMDALNEYGLH